MGNRLTMTNWQFPNLLDANCGLYVYRRRDTNTSNGTILPMMQPMTSTDNVSHRHEHLDSNEQDIELIELPMTSYR